MAQLTASGSFPVRMDFTNISNPQGPRPVLIATETQIAFDAGNGYVDRFIGINPIGYAGGLYTIATAQQWHVEL